VLGNRAFVDNLLRNEGLREKIDILLACGSYVELNPVRPGLIEDPKDYRWSSYHTYANGKRDPLVDLFPIYGELFGDERERR
jgi:putative transposase